MKIVMAADLHLCAGILKEMRATTALLPEGFYGHVKNNRLYWHNEMLVERMPEMLNALRRFVEKERPDMCVFLGDMVNTNWAANVAVFKKGLASFRCKTMMVSGNHDLYLGARHCRLEALFGVKLGMRSMMGDGIGVVFLDMFVKRNDMYFPSLGRTRLMQGTEYRPDDLRKTLELLDKYRKKDFIILAHMPMCEPDKHIQIEGRKMMTGFPRATAAFLDELQMKKNFMGLIVGHQHFNHLQFLRHGFHWSLPSLCEYPCACAVLDFQPGLVRGRLKILDTSCAKASLGSRGQKWPYGSDAERCFEYRKNLPHRHSLPSLKKT